MLDQENNEVAGYPHPGTGQKQVFMVEKNSSGDQGDRRIWKS